MEFNLKLDLLSLPGKSFKNQVHLIVHCSIILARLLKVKERLVGNNFFVLNLATLVQGKMTMLAIIICPLLVVW
jgi:hypothetical protein